MQREARVGRNMSRLEEGAWGDEVRVLLCVVCVYTERRGF